MPLIIFRTRLRPDVADRYDAHAEAVFRLAETMPGYISIKDFSSADGERLALIEWASHETLRSWREHPVHRAAQRLGRSDYYSEYSLQVCDVVRTSRFPRSEDATPVTREE